MWAIGRTLLVGCAVIASAAVLPVGNAEAATSACAKASVAGPTHTVAWRAGIEARTPVFYRLPGKSLPPSNWLPRLRWLPPSDAPWVLVVGPARDADGRCWLHIRLPWRPNAAAGWLNADNVVLEKTPWRIVVSRGRRTLTLFRAGARVHTFRVVVGKPSTPTPVGLFGIVWAIRWHPTDFLGSWVLELTAHSDVLRQFEGGDGTIGIHGRGGASLLDPLGSARSHGCIRMSNNSIDWLVHKIGTRQLPGTPVEVS